MWDGSVRRDAGEAVTRHTRSYAVTDDRLPSGSKHQKKKKRSKHQVLYMRATVLCTLLQNT